jgi:hypothetical protein
MAFQSNQDVGGIARPSEDFQIAMIKDLLRLKAVLLKGAFPLFLQYQDPSVL